MGRLSKHFARANDAVANLETEVSRDVDKIVERVQHAHRRKEQIFQRKHEMLDAHMSDLAEFERDLDEEELRGNGGPDGSDDGERSEVTGTEPGQLSPNAWTPPVKS